MEYSKDDAKTDLIKLLKKLKLSKALKLCDDTAEKYEYLATCFEKIINDLSLALYKNNYTKKPFQCYIFFLESNRYFNYSAATLNLHKKNPTYCICFDKNLLEVLTTSLSEDLKEIYMTDKRITKNPKIEFDNIGLVSENKKDILLWNILMSITIFHEIGHIFCGHMEPSIKKRQYGKYRHKEDIYLHHTEEYFADYFSFIGSLYYILFTCKGTNQFELFYDYVIANSILWANYCDYDHPIYVCTDDFYAKNDLRHAHPLTRMFYAIPWIKEEEKNLNIKLSDKIILESKYKQILNKSHIKVLAMPFYNASYEEEHANVKNYLTQYEQLGLKKIEERSDTISELYCRLSYYNYTDTNSLKRVIRDSIRSCYPIT